MFEILPEGIEPRVPDATGLVWPRGKGATSTVSTDLGAWLGSFGAVPSAAIDLVRITAGAFMADRLTPRGQGFTRTIGLHVRLVRTAEWFDVVERVADLLHWLTGDHWTIELSDDGIAAPAPINDAPSPVDTVALLSGGLDSFCGAVISGPERRLFLGHGDNSLVKSAQNAVRVWLDAAFGSDVLYEQVRVVQATPKKESSSRSRAVFFMALGVAAAAARGANIVEVPENGYTSLNPPLGPERGGALSTRSTHPLTIARFNAVLESLGLAPRVVVPYMDLTKGQLVARAMNLGIERFDDGIASTLSCGKLDGARYKGGNPNHHCGLCFPCVVRRGAIAAAGIPDKTVYLSDSLTGSPFAKLRAHRRSDVNAIRRALIDGVDDTAIIALGPFPRGFDLDAAVALCQLGLDELGGVELD